MFVIRNHVGIGRVVLCKCTIFKFKKEQIYKIKMLLKPPAYCIIYFPCNIGTHPNRFILYLIPWGFSTIINFHDITRHCISKGVTFIALSQKLAIQEG